ncbi:MAG: hypothetical protein A3B99_05145 [Candidatus Yanofskybacteria bacterium RIFCSPHIGHO2_02_FULL_44_12b]|uniref:Bacterial spore germination immunoglobulin-like domain-containing protein n=2 Tax=Candidatus Yanofskyibacteriota TaxID=1752733 RepID=A0A1F8GJ63_9BACT|nr:MAG: hypothetical protein UW79_C0023G0024 [Candidatus Yanofskybacteria bacterium GW2011_GWA2_44_9]OGN04266.1 MAG: hypothetical protein A2659_03200 [Candidatus Yanofskybacteria bacterium RIFCSPHIGHO2_01_FULL_44_24]OGN14372.1 MAG: hypothetical protein A3B99_05145 [Candidatus Yanofskybacteria bacterium RIFCSPHIGHO2_02_FULL_44_12b]OGN25373.1 MAG: hypothetical protein A2925_00710 [Candidatus Yanofskybacteria bacterium RIFCSPLOWO2_01_FULL_44_22]
MKKTFLIIGAVVIAGLVYLNLTYEPQKAKPQATPFVSDKVRVATPLPNQIIESPLGISGEARGTWFFEASFPVRLYDANGKEMAVAVAMTSDNWMTTEFVSFSTVLEFSQPETLTGSLVFQKDNPSGLPELDDEISIPVRFRK